MTRVETIVKPCLVNPPPARPAIARTPCEYEVCYDEANARKLATYLWEVFTWAEEAWNTCGNKEE